MEGGFKGAVFLKDSSPPSPQLTFHVLTNFSIHTASHVGAQTFPKYIVLPTDNNYHLQSTYNR